MLQLLETAVPRVSVPVVGAGGIATADRVRDVFAAGASAVRIGTRLLATPESAAHLEYLGALLAAGANATELTTAFGVGWEDAPHRVLNPKASSDRPSRPPSLLGGVKGGVLDPEVGETGPPSGP